jgi:hypothetical protein
MVVDQTTHHYAVYVQSPGQREALLGAGMAFRSESAAVTSLDNIAVFAGPGSLNACKAVVR